MSILILFWNSVLSTLRDVLPILAVLAFFQFAVLRRPLTNPIRLAWGVAFVIAGLALFLTGLELALFPLGESMAEQLLETRLDQATIEDNLSTNSNPAATTPAEPSQAPGHWYDYYWVYLFALAIGISTTVAEPSLIAVAIKAQEVSGGTIQAFGLRIAVALGVGIGVALGTFRIVTGIPLPYFILPGYLAVVIQTAFAPKQIVPLAYDSGGVTTSTVTVPLVAALGVGLATRVPGRDPMIDGFGLIAFASLFPMMTVMGYAQLAEWRIRSNQRKQAKQKQNTDEDATPAEPKSEIPTSSLQSSQSS